MGKPIYNDEGKITNLLLLSHSLEESFESYWGKDIILSEDFLFDRKDYFFVIIIPLGIPDSCSPSLTKLNHNFPKYTFEDRVNFKRQFLKEKFDFTKIHAILANSVGGYESLVWAYMYPDDMELLIVLSVTYRIRGDNYIAALSIKEIIESNENFYDEIYDNSLIRMMLPLFKLCYINSIPKELMEHKAIKNYFTKGEYLVNDMRMYDLVTKGVELHDFNTVKEFKNYFGTTSQKKLERMLKNEIKQLELNMYDKIFSEYSNEEKEKLKVTLRELSKKYYELNL